MWMLYAMYVRIVHTILIAFLAFPSLPTNADCGCSRTDSFQSDCCGPKEVERSRLRCGGENTSGCCGSESCHCGDACRCGTPYGSSPKRPLQRSKAKTTDDVTRLMLMAEGVIGRDCDSPCRVALGGPNLSTTLSARQVCTHLSRFLL